MNAPIIGAHVGTSGGLYTCFERADAICANGIQIFGASPRQWRVKQPSAKDLEQYHNKKKEYSKIGPVFLHASYLVNLASSNIDLYNKSVENLASHLQIAVSLGANGLIFHLGSFKGWSREEGLVQQINGMCDVLNKTPGEAFLIMENSAGGGDKLGTTLKEIGEMFHEVNHPRLKVCIDTQHAFASGMIKKYDTESIDRFLDECDQAFGLDNLICWHLNDSKSVCCSNVDRHENIGTGQIGLAGFEELAKNKRAVKMPWILEVPGFDGEGPDLENINIVKKLF